MYEQWHRKGARGAPPHTHTQEKGWGRVVCSPPPNIRVVNQIILAPIGHIFFLMFYGFCAHTNTDRLAPPPTEDSILCLWIECVCPCGCVPDGVRVCIGVSICVSVASRHRSSVKHLFEPDMSPTDKT